MSPSRLLRMGGFLKLSRWWWLEPGGPSHTRGIERLGAGLTRHLRGVEARRFGACGAR